MNQSDNRSIHVLQVTAAPGAGVLRHVLDVAEGLLESGLRLTLALPFQRVAERSSLRRLDALRRCGLTIRSFGLEPTFRPLTYPVVARRIARFVAAADVGIVHVHSSRAGALLRLLPVLPRATCRVIYTPHAFSFLQARRRIVARVYEQVERLAGRLRTDVLVAVSESERQLALARRIVPEDKLRVIPNGVCLPPEAEIADVERRPGDGRVRVLSVGRLCRQKDPLFFIEVAERVCAEREDIEFRWAGDGELALKVSRRLASSRYRGRITFLGHVDDMAEELRSAGALLSTSLYEGLPYAALEAAAFALPIVASDVVGNRDIVRHGHTGLLYRSGCVDSAADALLWVLASPQRLRALGRTSRRLVQERYALHSMVRRYLDLYRELHANGGGN